MDQSETTPGHAPEPRCRSGNDDVPSERAMKRRTRAWKRGARGVTAPAVEAVSRRESVYALAQTLSRVFPKIREHVDESVSHLPRCRELAAVPAVGPETAAASQEIVHVAGDADDETPEAGRQSTLVARFDQEVHVVPLHGKVEDPETQWVAPSGASHCETHRGEHMLAPKRAKRGPKRHVHGMSRNVIRTSAMGR
jgi:hypothetical protein